MAKTPKDEAQELAHRFCTLFLQLMRLQKLYDVDNVNLAEPLAKIQEVTAALVARSVHARGFRLGWLHD